MKILYIFGFLIISLWSQDVSNGFSKVMSDGGVSLYKKTYSGGQPDYIQKIDLSKGARVELFFGDRIENNKVGIYGGNNPKFKRETAKNLWENFKRNYNKAVSIVNGQFFRTYTQYSALSYPVISNGYRIDGDDGGFKNYKMVLEIKGNKVSLHKLDPNISDLSSLSDNAIVGLSTDISAQRESYIGRTIIGILDSDNNGIYESILIFSSSYSKQNDAIDILTNFGVPKDKILMLDGGPSSKLVYKGEHLISSTQIVPQAIGVIRADDKVVYKEGIFDGAGSLISPNDDCWGCDKDEARMHSHRGTGSTVVFQWLYDANSCSNIDLEANITTDVVIKLKGWNSYLTQKAFKTTISLKPITLSRPDNNNQWTTLAVTSLNSIDNTTKVYAYCRKPNDEYSQGDRESIDIDLVDVTSEYFWTGTGSIINKASQRPSNPFGIDRDSAVTFDNHNSLTSFQWYATDSCSRLNIINENGYSQDQIKEVKIKDWYKRDWSEDKCGDRLPCSIDAPYLNKYYIIKVKSLPNAITDGMLRVECIN